MYFSEKSENIHEKQAIQSTIRPDIFADVI